ncbi:MAG: hypothetical protein QNJ72_29560 [Pleurocapsa sp. MO_226.B13]|nr:hypothetical protein [Pleurocapsa sp. MO_226.B13]
MTFINFAIAIVALVISTCFFCLIMTTDLGWGPIAYVACFLGGIVLMGWASAACLDLFKE